MAKFIKPSQLMQVEGEIVIYEVKPAPREAVVKAASLFFPFIFVFDIILCVFCLGIMMLLYGLFKIFTLAFLILLFTGIVMLGLWVQLHDCRCVITERYVVIERYGFTVVYARAEISNARLRHYEGNDYCSVVVTTSKRHFAKFRNLDYLPTAAAETVLALLNPRTGTTEKEL